MPRLLRSGAQLTPGRPQPKPEAGCQKEPEGHLRSQVAGTRLKTPTDIFFRPVTTDSAEEPCTRAGARTGVQIREPTHRMRLAVGLFQVAIHGQAEASYPVSRGMSSTSRTACVKVPRVNGFSRRLTPSSKRPAWIRASRE